MQIMRIFNIFIQEADFCRDRVFRSVRANYVHTQAVLCHYGGSSCIQFEPATQQRHNDNNSITV